MKWSKRAALLLAALLLLATAAQARVLTKAPSGSEDGTASMIHTVSGRNLPEPQKVTVTQKPPIFPEQETEARIVTPLTPAPKETVPEQNRPPAASRPSSAAASQPSSAAVSTPKAPAKKEEEGPAFPEAEDWQLMLVNPWNEMPEDYDVTLKALPDGQKVDERAYADLTAMLQACRDDGLAPKVCSAYRTMAKQTYLYNNKISRLIAAGYSKKSARAEAGRWVARPGTSEHQLGLAVDIVATSYQGLTKKQERTAEQKWLMEHCWEYGFILRYPNDKSDITGIGYEPWHYRYVGVEVAQDVRESGLCFEEYLLLREETLAERTR